jgi:hypothetical protein
VRNIVVVNLFELDQNIFNWCRGSKKHPVSIFQRSSRVVRKTSASQPCTINSANARRIAISNKEGQHILHYLRLSTNHRVPPHAHKLMRADIVGKKDVILNGDVSGKRDFVGEDIIVAYTAVMRDVYAHHEEVARTDPRHLIFAAGAMKRAKLPNQVVVANLEEAWLTFELYVLRLSANHGMLEDPVARADFSELLDNRVCANLTIWANFDVIFDYGCGMDRHFETVFIGFSRFSG